MAQCVVWQGAALVATVDAPEACQGYVLLQSTEYTNAMSLAQGLQIPTSDQIGAAFALGFILPATCYVVARTVRAIFLWE
nr:MAG TPA: tail protein [Inoviridae sp.]